MKAWLILSMVVALWPAAVHAQTRVAVDTTADLQAVADYLARLPPLKQ